MLSEKAYANRLEYTRKWRKRNKDKVKAVAKKRLDDGRMMESLKKYGKKNPNKIKKWNKEYRDRNVEKLKVAKAAYYQDNKEELNAKRKAHYQANKKSINKKSLAVRHASPHKMLRHNISSAVRLKLLNHGGKKNKASIDRILPYTIDELSTRLESLFKPGMSWDNMGDWHVDHIVPDSSFDYTSVKDPEFVQSWALDNLQPLWASENCSKGSKNITEA